MREMKNSEIEWIGNIPSSWQLKFISECFKERREKVSDYDWKPLSVTKHGIVEQLETAAKSDAHDDRKKVCKGDFVINSRSDRKQSCGLSDLDGSVSLINIVLENKKLRSEYIKYLLKNYGFAEEFYRWGSGIVADLWSTNYQKMKKIMIPVPSLEEQEKIGKFLDEKVTNIDKVIEKTRETIEDYKKYKQSIITEVVTKGLDQNAKIKYSGSLAVGDVPKSWKANKIKYISDINPKFIVNIENIDEVTYTPMEYIRNGYYIKNVGLWENNTSSYNTYIENDIVMAKVTPCFENGNIAIMEHLKNGVGYGSSELIVFRAKKDIDNKYLFYLLQSEIFKKSCIATMTGTGGLKRVSVEFIKNYICYIPRIEEQKRIINFLDNKCNVIDKLIDNKQKIVEGLEAYKKSLIYEYVTGKKEVISEKNTEMAELSLRIIEQLPNNYSMCKIKLNKIQSVILKMIKYDKEPDYEKYAAGPYSKEMMNDVYDTFETEKWVKISKDSMRDVYTLDENYKEGIKRYKKHFKEYDNEITRIIKLFENKDTQESEVIATLFYCWNDFLIDGIQATDNQIIKQFYAWSKRKKYIKTTKVKNNLDYMRKNNLIPNGYGKKTIQRSNGYGRK